MIEKREKDNFEEYVAHSSQCDPTNSICLMDVQRKPQEPANTTGEPARDYPEINLTEKNWRAHTLANKKVIPAGYTYFGQLLGHDLGRSIKIEHVPYTDKRQQIGSDAVKPPVRYNVIENPLTLETIYGSGPTMLPHLFDPKTFLFRIDNSFVISKVHDLSDPSIRALYDSRNRDTIILHRLATIWMNYHNKIAISILPELALQGIVPTQRKGLAYAQARSRVLATWHHLILNDFLPRFVDPTVMKIDCTSIQRFDVLDETSLLHGLFRSFHCLPRRKYQFPETHFLSEILLKSHDHHEMPAAGWGLNWDMFFSEQPGGTKTGMCASFSSRLATSNGVPISQLDLITAQETNPLRLNDDTIQKIVTKLGSALASKLEPKNLADAFNKKVANQLNLSITESEVSSCPLYVVLMLEAQLYGKKGRFGPLGSVLLRRSIEHTISKIRTDMLVQTNAEPQLPDTIIELIKSI